MRRFFVNPDDISGKTAVLGGREAHHLATVLRYDVDQLIRLFDGKGKIYEARITSIDKYKVEASILSSSEKQAESSIPLHIGQALMKGKKTDTVIQKATELGVTSFHPFVSRYCISRDMTGQRGIRRNERWTQIAMEACKQSNRAVPMECLPLNDFDWLIDEASYSSKYDLKLIFWEEENKRTLDAIVDDIKSSESVFAIIGPEGGFSKAEVAKAVEAGFLPVSLGHRILRAETASLSAISILQYLLGNLNESS